MAELPRMHSIQTLSPGASFTTVILVQESLFALRELHLLNALLCPSITEKGVGRYDFCDNGGPLKHVHAA